MALLLPQFEEAKSNVEPSEKDRNNAPKAHAMVREVLEADSYLSDLGIATVLIGSYARHVSIRRMRDVDVFSKLPDLHDDVDPRKLLKVFVDVLTGGLGEERVEPQERSIKVLFPDFDLDVDAVPGRPKDGYWEIPDRTERGGGWEETNPERLGGLTTEMNKAHNELYVPVVKLIRQTRRANLVKDHPGGLYFEILTYHGFASGNISGGSITEYYCSALNAVADQLNVAVGQGLADPTLEGRFITTRATQDDLRLALRTFRSLSSRAAGALGEDDRCRAAKVFREILGRNGDDEVVFPMPDDCNEDGTKMALAAVTAGDRNVPAGNRRFA